MRGSTFCALESCASGSVVPAPSEICLRATPTPSGDSEAGGSGGYVLIHGFLRFEGGADLLIGLSVAERTRITGFTMSLIAWVCAPVGTV